MIHDTSSSTQDLIDVWINDAYQDAWRRGLWSDLIDDDYTFTSVADQATYSLPADFGKEVIVADITNGHLLKRFTEKMWWEERALDYNAATLDSGNPTRYVILLEAGNLKLDPPPQDGSETYAMPYQKTVSDLSDSNTTPEIATISTYLEKYAIGMGQSYFQQYGVADWWLNRTEIE
jgi:hypothetical protein